MWHQILAIAWAQLRTTRNHLPRTSVGTVLMWLLSLLWYGIYVGVALLLIVQIPQASLSEVRQWLPVGMFGVLLYWQIVPLFTLSSGWSLQINKLQVYPIDHRALFGIEVLLRLTSAPEMVMLLCGAMVGLLRRDDVSPLFPFLLILYIPMNLFLLLAVRNFILHSFEHNRFRELFAVVLISIGILPQFVLRTEAGHRLAPYFWALSQNTFAPWHELASLSLGPFSVPNLISIAFWIALTYAFAARQFQKSLVRDDSFRPGSSRTGVAPAQETRSKAIALAHLPGNFFPDPLGALLQKEFQSLLRMPRFRVIFGMACVFSVVIFIPMTLRGTSHPDASFLNNNFLPIVNLYGLLLLSDILLLNIFGFDRAAAQVYFVAPVPFSIVVKAKNLIAVSFIVLQSLAVLVVATLVHASITLLSAASSIAASAVVSTLLLSVGNLTSVLLPRPIDATQTFKKQAGAKMQLWLLLCTLGIFLLVGLAFLARWAFQRDWVLLGVLLLEFAAGLIFYRIATESAVQRGERNREKIIDALSKGGSPVSLGL